MVQLASRGNSVAKDTISSLMRIYIPAPTRKTSPNGPIALRNIIKSPHYSEESKNEHSLLLISDTCKNQQRGWKGRQKKTLNPMTRFFTLFLEKLSLKSNLGFQSEGYQSSTLSAMDGQ